MSLAKTTRRALGITQSEFGIFLAEKTGRDPIMQCQISGYETGRHAMNKEQTRVCSPIAAAWLAVECRTMTVEEAAALILESLN